MRPVRGFPANTPQGQQVLGLADARQISDRIVYATPAVQVVLPLMDGKRGLDDIVKEVGRGLTRAILEQLVAQLDDAALLEGPTFDALLAKSRADFDTSPNLPPASSAAFADALVKQGVEQQGEAPPQSADEAERRGAEKLRGIFDQWMTAALEKAPVKAFTALPRAIIAPHLDYPRGWLNYAGAWGRLRGVERPARVVILGTNHFGQATGVCGCDKGYETPLGLSEVDHGLVGALRTRLGAENAAKLFEQRYDHEREHSIELQVPWIQHIFGKGEDGRFVPVFGALMPDPTVNEGKSYDGKGLDTDPFVVALEGAIAELPGPTLIVASADLSHVGPAFGDQQKLAGEAPEVVQFREKTVKHDREMLGLLGSGKIDELLASMSWQQNPSRWCSIGNLVATVRVAKPTRVEILNYAAAMDQEGFTFVSSTCAVMT